MTRQRLVDVLHRPIIDGALLFNCFYFLVSCGVLISFGSGVLYWARIAWEEPSVPHLGLPSLLPLALFWLTLSVGLTLAGGCGALFWGRWLFRRYRPVPPQATQAETTAGVWPPPPSTGAEPPAA